MATPIMMPNVGISVESCILTEWHKKKGESVKAGEVLFTYETDKTSVDEPASVDGIILEQFFNEGDDIPVMTNVCVIGQEGESFAEFAPGGAAASASSSAVAAPAAETVSAPSEATAAPAAPVAALSDSDGFIKISPRARALAAKTGIEPSMATPTGAEGRIVENDIRVLADSGVLPAAAAATAPAATAADVTAAPAAEYTDEKLSGIRRAIAKSMKTSLSTIPQLTHTVSFDATEIMALRKKLKANAESLGMGNITLNDIILYAVSRILAKPEHKALNAHMIDDDHIRYFNGVNLGVAIDTERGLMVPTIFNADKKSLSEIADEAKELAAACKKGDISPDKLKGGSFTISNLGSFGIESFTPVINPPQTGILGVDGITTRVKETENGIATYPAMGLSLTYDHRAVDGAPASSFLVDLKNSLQNFTVLLCK